MFARLAVMLLVAFALVAAAPPPGTPQERRIAALIDKLGEDDFDTREAAHKELQGLGNRAAPQLFHAFQKNGDLEIRKRSRRLIREAEGVYWQRVQRYERRPSILKEIRQARGINAITWGESMVNPFTNLTDEGKKKLLEQGIDVQRLTRMRARWLVGNGVPSFVNTDPDTLLVFGNKVRAGSVSSAGPILVAESAHLNQVRGADLVWIVEKAYLSGDALGSPIIAGSELGLWPKRSDPPDLLTGDYGWRRPDDFGKPLLAATNADPAQTDDIAFERKRLSGQIEETLGIPVRERARYTSNPFTNLTDEGKKKLEARGVNVKRLARLKEALCLTGRYMDKKDPWTFANQDAQTVLVLGDGFVTTGAIFSLGPVVVVGEAQCLGGITGADVVWFTESTVLRGKLAGAPAILAPTLRHSEMKPGNDQVWCGDYGWRRPKDWPDWPKNN
jgi:hypothetical protein